MSGHEPAVFRDGNWGPVTIVCSCGKWNSDGDKGPVSQDVAWLKWETHHRPTYQGLSGIGSGYAAVRTTRVLG